MGLRFTESTVAAGAVCKVCRMTGLRFDNAVLLQQFRSEFPF